MSEHKTAILGTDERNNAVVTPIVNLFVTPRPKPIEPYIPEGSQKRELPIGSTPSPSLLQNELKRSRDLSGEFDYTITNSVMEKETEAEVTMLDLLKLLKQTA